MGWWLGLCALACGGQPPLANRADELVGTRMGQLARANLAILGEGMDDELFLAVLADPRVPALRDLGAGRNRLTARAVRAILTSPDTQAQERLDLALNPIGDEGLVLVAGWEGLATIQALDVSGVGATVLGIEALARSAHTPALKTLAAGHQAVGDAGAAALVQLRVSAWIALPQAGIGAAGARALIRDARTPSLELSGNPLGPGAIESLDRLAPGLVSLGLGRAGLAARDAARLAQLDAPALRSLSQESNALGDAGLAALASAPWLARLEALDVGDNGASEAVYAAIRRAWGDRRGLSADLPPGRLIRRALPDGGNGSDRWCPDPRAAPAHEAGGTPTSRAVEPAGSRCTGTGSSPRRRAPSPPPPSRWFPSWQSSGRRCPPRTGGWRPRCAAAGGATLPGTPEAPCRRPTPPPRRR